MSSSNLASGALLALILIGCGSAPQQAAEPQQDAAARQASPIADVVSVYDALRARLSNEETAGLAAGFTRLQSVALDAANEVDSEALKDHLQGLRDAAAEGAEAGDDDLPGAIAVFGEVSEHLVAAIASDPSLAHGLYVFECPMTEGYPKWVQASETAANPYMGKAMQSCGVGSEWSK